MGKVGCLLLLILLVKGYGFNPVDLSYVTYSQTILILEERGDMVLVVAKKKENGRMQCW